MSENQAASIADQLRGMHILVVEDEWVLADLICVRLEERGARVAGPYRNAREGMAALDSEIVNFAIIDMVLNDSVADDLLEALVARNVPHIVITGFSALPTNAGEHAVAHLRKPIQWDYLWSLLEGHIGPSGRSPRP